MPNSSAVGRLASEPLGRGSSITTGRDEKDPNRLLRFQEFREYYGGDSSPQWRTEVLRQLFEFVTLPEGWDSYGGRPLRPDAGSFALYVLNTIMRSQTPRPHVVPSSSGAVQLEWHEKDVDLELYIAAPYECELWFEDHQSGEQLSAELSNDFTLLDDPITKLTTR
jgi:hypothetical protein